MANDKDSASDQAGKPAPIPCTVLSGDTLNALLAVHSGGVRITLDLDVLGERCIHLILAPDNGSTSRCASLAPWCVTAGVQEHQLAPNGSPLTGNKIFGCDLEPDGQIYLRSFRRGAWENRRTSS